MPIAAGLVAFTVTPGSTALLVSATLPLIDPVVLAPPPWACATAGDSVASAARHTAAALETTARAIPPVIETPPRCCRDRNIAFRGATDVSRDFNVADGDAARTIQVPVAHCSFGRFEQCAKKKKAGWVAPPGLLLCLRPLSLPFTFYLLRFAFDFLPNQPRSDPRRARTKNRGRLQIRRARRHRDRLG